MISLLLIIIFWHFFFFFQENCNCILRQRTNPLFFIRHENKIQFLKIIAEPYKYINTGWRNPKMVIDAKMDEWKCVGEHRVFVWWSLWCSTQNWEKKCNFTLSIISFFVHLFSRIFEHFAIIPLYTLQDFDIHFEKMKSTKERERAVLYL